MPPTREEMEAGALGIPLAEGDFVPGRIYVRADGSRGLVIVPEGAAPRAFDESFNPLDPAEAFIESLREEPLMLIKLPPTPPPR